MGGPSIQSLAGAVRVLAAVRKAGLGWEVCVRMAHRRGCPHAVTERAGEQDGTGPLWTQPPRERESPDSSPPCSVFPRARQDPGASSTWSSRPPWEGCSAPPRRPRHLPSVTPSPGTGCGGRPSLGPVPAEWVMLFLVPGMESRLSRQVGRWAPAMVVDPRLRGSDRRAGPAQPHF